MTLDIISRSIFLKVWDLAGIELATAGSAVRLATGPGRRNQVTNDFVIVSKKEIEQTETEKPSSLIIQMITVVTIKTFLRQKDRQPGQKQYVCCGVGRLIDKTIIGVVRTII